MRYIDEFRNENIAKKLSKAIFDKAKDLPPLNIMEVCGTHTMSICHFGIRGMLPKNINLISGPGCPVCVTPKSYIDTAIEISRFSGTIVATFGDMMKVPGSHSSLQYEKSEGRSIKVLYSVLDAVELADGNRDKKVVFLGVGFETTSPTVAASIVYAEKKKVRNFFVYSGHKLILPAMEALVKDHRTNIDGFLCPAHVSTIIGATPYEKITKGYNVPCVIAGFEPIDILQGILMLVQQIRSNESKVENQYKRAVKKSGNKKALSLLEEVFSVTSSEWRGIGEIERSGFLLKKRYSVFSAEKAFPLPNVKTRPEAGCICGSVLRGIKTPFDCKLFAKKCTPLRPVGACMVSSEGTCAAYYKYRKRP